MLASQRDFWWNLIFKYDILIEGAHVSTCLLASEYIMLLIFLTALISFWKINFGQILENVGWTPLQWIQCSGLSQFKLSWSTYAQYFFAHKKVFKHRKCSIFPKGIKKGSGKKSKQRSALFVQLPCKIVFLAKHENSGLWLGFLH